ncbi:uncharacterized protein ISCGN_006054 [Ixodes scapularis]
MSAASTSVPPPPPRKRFTAVDDIFLLREVLGANPFLTPALLNDVLKGLNAASKKNFSLRGARERIDLLVTLYKKNDRINLRKSGTEEQFDEKARLLLECVALYDEFGRTPAKTLKGKRPTSNAASQQREEAVSWIMQESTGGADEGDQSATALLEEIYAVPSDGEEEGMAPTEPCSQEPTFSGILRSNGLTSAEKHPAPATRPTLQGGRKRNLSRGLEFLDMKFQAKNRVMIEEQKLRKEQQKIENRRIDLEEARVSLERERQTTDGELAHRKLIMEEEDRLHQRQLMTQQAEMIEKMVDQMVETNQLLHQLLSKKSD